jgi:hypothetical protein
MVNVLLFKDWIAPVPLRERPVEVPDEGVAAILATGVAVPASPVNANFALVVEVPPNSKSNVLLEGDIALLFNWK